MYSLVFKNVKVIDGLGNPWYYADVGIEGDKIVHIGRIEGGDSPKIIDGKNMALAAMAASNISSNGSHTCLP